MPKGAVVFVAGMAGLVFSTRSPAPNLNFEEGLRGWTATGSAFREQPILEASIAVTDVSSPVPLGGDYWRGLTYPIGASGAHLVRSSDEGRGTLTSDEITPDPEQRFFSLLVGGAADSTKLRVELEIRSRSGDPARYRRDGDYLIIKDFTGSGADRLHEDAIEIPRALRGRPARVRIIDDSSGTGGHIEVDDIRFTAVRPVRQHTPLWGIADYHAHPMNYMAFGALRGVRTVWGVPGGNYSDYLADPRLVSRDIPACIKSHGGGPAAEIFINTAEGRFALSNNPFVDLFHLIGAQNHGHSGGTTFQDFPSFLSGLHYQMHVTQIHRAWEGGLRLMVAIAVHNLGVEYLFSKPRDGIVDPSTERQVLDAQVCGMKALAALNSDWMEIAYSPADARRIIERNKLAVVLGVEMDQLGTLDRDADSCTTLRPCPFDTFDDEIDYLWKLGIRQVTPVHAVDNRLGSAAVFEPVYNSLNDLLNRGRFNLTSGDLRHWPAHFFEVREGGCGSGPNAGRRGECVAFQFAETQKRPALTRTIFSPFRGVPFLVDEKVPAYRPFEGMMNEHGLTIEGRDYIKHLMRQGVIVGLEHLSQQSVDDVHGIVADVLREHGHVDCAAFGQSAVPEHCYDEAYPLLASHGSFRALTVYGPDSTTVPGFRPSEYEFSDRDAALMGRTGGFLGQFTAVGPVIPPQGFAGVEAVNNDCAGSSKSFVLSYLYGLRHLRGSVGLATDFTIIAGTSPRFGPHACWAYHAAADPQKERSMMPGQYRLHDQKDGVVYGRQDVRVPDDVAPGRNQPLTAYSMDRRRAPFDYNVDGFAHYGMLPDFLQDVKNVGMPRDAFEALFSSAEAYVRTWEKIGRVMNVTYPENFRPLSPACEVACRDLCPDSPNAGAPRPRN